MTSGQLFEKEALFSQGNDLLAARDYAAAAACFRAVTALSPEEVSAWINLGISQQSLGLHDAAVLSYRKALELEPENPQAVCNLAMALRPKGLVREAVSLFEVLIRKGNAPDPVLYNQMLCLADCGDYEGSFSLKEELLSRSLTAALRLRTATFFPQMMPGSARELSELRHRYDKSVAELYGDETMKGSLFAEDVVGHSFYMAYHGENDKPLQEGMAAFLKTACPDLRFVAPHCRHGYSRTRKRTRLGVYSQYLRDHTIGRLFGLILPELDRSRFELFVLALSQPNDTISTRICSGVEHFLVVPKLIDEARNFIASLELDILLYPDVGMDRFSYALSFARLAPVQCVTWGHPVTTGMESIDYFITADELETLPGSEVYTEKPLLLTTPGIYYEKPRPGCVKTREELGLPDDARLYLCVQSLFKIHPDFDAIARAILEADQHGMLVLVGRKNELLCNRITAGNSELVQRIRFVDSMPRDDFLALISSADLLLDTPHFSGGNTSIECFALGQPVVTMPSPYLKGRITTALYRAMGMDEPVVSSKDEYVQMALRIAEDSDYKAGLAAAITDSSARLFRSRTVVDQLETLLDSCRRAWV